MEKKFVLSRRRRRGRATGLIKEDQIHKCTYTHIRNVTTALRIGTFATKNSVHLGRFRVKNATVRAGKSLYYGLRLYTRLFGVGNATVWGYFCDSWRFVISCLRLYFCFLRFEFVLLRVVFAPV